MSMHTRTRRLRQAGGGLIVSMLVLAFVLPLVAVSLSLTTNHARNARRDRDYQEHDIATHAVMEYAYAKWKSWIKTNGGRSPLYVNCLPSTNLASVPPLLGITATEAQTLLNGSLKFAGTVVNEISIEPVDAKDFPVTTANGDETAQKNAMRALIPLESMSRRFGRTYIYRCTVRTTTASSSNTEATKLLKTKITRYFRKADASLWQSMMWFEGDLELFPTPAMPLYGWIHTNSNAYLAHSNNADDLTINSDFTFTGSPGTISKGSASTIQNALGLIYGVSNLQQQYETAWANWKAPVWAGGGYAAQVANISLIDPLSQPRAEVIDTTDGSLNNDSFREIIERPTDTDSDGLYEKSDDVVTGTTATAFQDRRYYTAADIKIIINRSLPVAQRIKVLDKNDAVLTDTFATNLATQALGKNATTGLPATTTLYDYREAGNVTSSSAAAAYTANGDITVTNVDVDKLTPLLNGYTGYSTGVIYFKDETPTGTAGVSNKRAARLQKGGVLPTIGMTYHATTGAIVTQPNSNASGGDPLVNTVGTYEPKPAAVCADAVSFLSNAWPADGIYTASTATNSRAGTATTFNTAFMSGYVPTDTTAGATTGVRSGGGINFPRVLEKWSGNALTYHGSMVQLFNSQVFNTAWRPQIYGAPKRPWNFETRFINDPPPGPLEFTEYSRGRLVRGTW